MLQKGVLRTNCIDWLDRINAPCSMHIARQTSWAISICFIGDIIMTHGDDAGLMPPSKNCPNSSDNHTNLKEGWWNSHLEHLCHLLYSWKQDLCILSLLITMPHVYFLGPQHIRLCTNTNVMPGSIWFHHAKQSPLVQHSTPSVPAHGKEELAHFICQGILRSIQKPLYNNQKTDLNPQRPHYYHRQASNFMLPLMLFLWRAQHPILCPLLQVLFLMNMHRLWSTMKVEEENP